MMSVVGTEYKDPLLKVHTQLSAIQRILIQTGRLKLESLVIFVEIPIH